MNLPLRLAALFFVSAFLLSSQVVAQKMTISQMKFLDDGSLMWNSGASVSRDGVAVKFELIVDTANKPQGYRFEKAGIETLKSGDRIALYLIKIKYGGSFGNYRDDSGDKVFASGSSVPGAWKTVTVDSIKPLPKGVGVLIKETIKLLGDKTVTRLEFGSEAGGFVTDITGSEPTRPAPASAPANKPPPAKKPEE